MDFERVFRLVFVLYCTAVGTLLVMMPWTPSWDLILAHLHFSGVEFLKTSLARGGLSGFGMVHLVWGLYDLNFLLGGRPSGYRETNSETTRDQ